MADKALVFAIVFIALLLGASSFILSTAQSGGASEVGTSCASGQFAVNETALGVFQCKAAGGNTNPIIINGQNDVSCTDTTSGTAKMMGFGLNYTTSPLSSGKLFVVLTFQTQLAAVSGISSQWQIAYGTGSPPVCNGAATGTTLGQMYTIGSQAASASGTPQSIGVAITGLSPSTTYWFDIQSTDSSTDADIYSKAAISIFDATASLNPNISYATSTASCTTGTTTTKNAGLGLTFTTGGAGFTGNVFVDLTFQVKSPATSGIFITYTPVFGTGATPACNTFPAQGTLEGSALTVQSQAAVVDQVSQNEGFVISGLSASTTYWIDMVGGPNTITNWVLSNPTIAVMELPSPISSLPSAISPNNSNSCTIASVSTLPLGFGTTYELPISTKGNIYGTLTFQITSPAKIVNTKFRVISGIGTGPTCNAAIDATTATSISQQYQYTSQAAVVGRETVSINFVLNDVNAAGGTTVWVDVLVTDSTTDSWIFLNPILSVAEYPTP